MRGVPHSDETRAAVLAALLAGQSVGEVARQFKLSHPTVIDWRDKAGLGSTHVGPKTKDAIGELVLAYLRSTLSSLAVQADNAADSEWIKKYGPADAATLFGVMSDKGFRLLEALQEVESQPGSEPSP